MDGVSQAAQTSIVDQALASRPPNVFDPYALIGALEHLEDVACYAAHADLRRFTVVLTSCKKLPPSPRLGDLVTRILRNDIEKEVTKTAAKMYKSSVPFPLTPKDGGVGYSRPVQDLPYPRGGGRQPPRTRNVRCFKCCHFRQIARNCLQSSMNTLASKGPRGDPIATPSVCSYRAPLNWKSCPLVATLRRCARSVLVRFKSYVVLNQLFMNALFARSCIVSSKGAVSERGRHVVRNQDVTNCDFQVADFICKFKNVSYCVMI